MDLVSQLEGTEYNKIADKIPELELEFVVLNQLVDIAKSGVPGLKTITDDSVPESTLTSNPSEMQSQPDSDRTFVTRPEWLTRGDSGSDTGEAKSISPQMTRRMSSPAPLGSIPEGQAMSLQAMSLQAMLTRPGQRSRSDQNVGLDRIGVIPDP
jgi:hypothetical protein